MVVPQNYESGDFYYHLNASTVLNRTCDSLVNDNVKDEGDYKCNDRSATECDQDAFINQDTCQRRGGVSYADLPMQILVYEADSPSCPDQCGGSTGNTCISDGTINVSNNRSHALEVMRLYYERKRLYSLMFKK